MIKRNSIANAKALTETPLIVRLPRSEIHLDPNQPRNLDKHTPEALKALAATMKSEGQQQAIKVRPHPELPEEYMLVFGEGRWLAAEIGEIEYLDCIITEETNIGKIRVMQITENLQRQDMSQFDTAKAFRELIDLGECENAAAVARRFGMSDATVSVYLKVLEASPEVQALAASGAATMDSARTLAEVEKTNPGKAKEIIEEGQRTGKVKREAVREAHAGEKAKQGKAPKAPKAAPKAPASDTTETPPSDAGTKLTPVEAWPFPKPNQGATPQPAAAPVQPADDAQSSATVELKPSPITVAGYVVEVAILPNSAMVENFNSDVQTHGAATLAEDIIHTDPVMAWVQFGRGTDKSTQVPYPCADLKILRIVRRD